MRRRCPARPSLAQKYRAYVVWGQQKALPATTTTQAFDELVRDRSTRRPRPCADELQHCVDEIGADTLIFRVQWPGMAQAAILSGMRLLGEQVRPRVSAKPWPAHVSG